MISRFQFFYCLNATIPLTSTLANDYPVATRPVRRMLQCKGTVSLAMPYFPLRSVTPFVCFKTSEPLALGIPNFIYDYI